MRTTLHHHLPSATPLDPLVAHAWSLGWALLAAAMTDAMDDAEDDSEPEEATCSRCNGSGEGMADGTTCSACRGTGVAPDLDAEEDEAIRRADEAYDRAKDERVERGRDAFDYMRREAAEIHRESERGGR